MRKIVQLTAAGFSRGDFPQEYLYAACDDGTVWMMECPVGGPTDKWVQLPSIPGDYENEERE